MSLPSSLTGAILRLPAVRNPRLIGDMAKKNRFGAIRSWIDAPESDEIRLVKYENLTGPEQAAEMESLLRFCGVNLPPEALATVLQRYSFARMNERQGTATVSHYRKGQAGDWANHFDDDIYEAFDKVTGDLVERLGYPSFRQK